MFYILCKHISYHAITEHFNSVYLETGNRSMPSFYMYMYIYTKQGFICICSLIKAAVCNFFKVKNTPNLAKVSQSEMVMLELEKHHVNT